MDGMLLNMFQPYIDRFWEKINKKSDDECWNWTGAHNSAGYGVYGTPAKYAHRISYTLHYGKLPRDFFVCHTCDNPSCVNPHHLFRGTSSDNMRDRNIKNRNNLPHGENHHWTKLNEQNIVSIRKFYADGTLNEHQLADLFGVSIGNISSIINRKSWKHIK